MVTLKNILLISCLTFIQFVSAYQNYEKCIKPGDFALTFDDGPNSTTEIVLDLLKKENVKATFFVNGQNYLGEVRKSSKAQVISLWNPWPLLNININRIINSNKVLCIHLLDILKYNI